MGMKTFENTDGLEFQNVSTLQPRECTMKEAFLYKKLSDSRVQCRLCNHFCMIDEGQRGLCGVRENRAGTLFSLVYGKIIAGHCDPIEKKPLFHFLPGSLSYSIATVGCNFKCLFCQNADISQMPLDHDRIVGEDTAPEAIVSAALNQGQPPFPTPIPNRPSIWKRHLKPPELQMKRVSERFCLQRLYDTGSP
jgi:uncharacterized Fe-S radical SAM superfamily protein PflX